MARLCAKDGSEVAGAAGFIRDRNGKPLPRRCWQAALLRWCHHIDPGTMDDPGLKYILWDETVKTAARENWPGVPKKVTVESIVMLAIKEHTNPALFSNDYIRAWSLGVPNKDYPKWDKYVQVPRVKILEWSDRVGNRLKRAYYG